ncbi:MAG: RDD family protein [Actinomycetes bacterium]|jgi:uncharacterized RDD family membrane protein YckC
MGETASFPVPLAGWGRRALAGIIDLAPLVLLLFWDGTIWRVAVAVAYLWLLGHLDGVTGQSPGKALLGLRVVDAAGADIGGRAGVIRRFLHVVDLAPLGLGFLLALVHVRRQTIADRLLSTFVVSGFAPRKPSLGLWIPPRSG